MQPSVDLQERGAARTVFSRLRLGWRRRPLGYTFWCLVDLTEVRADGRRRVGLVEVDRPLPHMTIATRTAMLRAVREEVERELGYSLVRIGPHLVAEPEPAQTRNRVAVEGRR